MAQNWASAFRSFLKVNNLEPMITPSALFLAKSCTCSEVETPKPTQIGRLVSLFRRVIICRVSSDTSVFAPVIEGVETA